MRLPTHALKNWAAVLAVWAALGLAVWASS